VGKFIHVDYLGESQKPSWERALSRMESYLFSAQSRKWQGIQLSERQDRNLVVYGFTLIIHGRVKYLKSKEAREHDEGVVKYLLEDIFGKTRE
jgi:hypothetical protein